VITEFQRNLTEGEKMIQELQVQIQDLQQQRGGQRQEEEEASGAAASGDSIKLRWEGTT